MTRKEAEAYIRSRRGKIIGVVFTKRTNNEVRRMCCRLGVRKYLTGKGAAYDAAEKGLLVVFDMGRRAYRSVPLDGLTAVRVGGELIPVTD